MSYPVGPPPDGAYVVGSDYGQGVTETSATQAMRTPALAPWVGAQNAWKGAIQERFNTVADLSDGQNGYADRLDLLETANGHCSAVMHRNWQVARNQWVTVPFPTQVGPGKRANVTTDGRIALRAGGLWRVDVLMNCHGYQRNYQFAGQFNPATYRYWPLQVQYRLEVLNGAGTVLTQREFLAQPGGKNYTQTNSPDDSRMLPSSASFSHTFVVENMPGQEAEAGAPSGWVYVRLRMYAGEYPIEWYETATFVNNIFGGTKLSGLTASRWSRDTANNVRADTVPDGGTLT